MKLINRLPLAKGLLEENSCLKNKTRFGVGGNAEVLFIPEDMDDLILFLRNIPKDINVTTLGAMSNVLIRDGGIKGVVIILGDFFKKVFVEDNIIEVGAGVNCSKLATIAMDNELGGLEFLMGLPGTIGGAIKMNAGCYGSEISNVLYECEVVTTDGKMKWFKANDMKFEYRASSISEDMIITRAWFRGIPNVSYSIPKRVKDIVEKRKNSQPIEKKSCGSFFKNPSDQKAWELIELSGCRGMKVGGAAISDKHANFIINEDGATSSDIEALGEKVREEVEKRTGVKLELEVICLGDQIDE